MADNIQSLLRKRQIRLTCAPSARDAWRPCWGDVTRWAGRVNSWWCKSCRQRQHDNVIDKRRRPLDDERPRRRVEH